MGRTSCRIRLVWCISLGLLISGCAAGRTDAILLNSSVHYTPLPSNEGVVLTTTDFNGPYVELGMIHVSGVSREGYESLNGKLRAQARQMGADAVIFVHYSTENLFSIIPFFVSIPYDVLTAEGVAVRSKNR